MKKINALTIPPTGYKVVSSISRAPHNGVKIEYFLVPLDFFEGSDLSVEAMRHFTQKALEEHR